MLAASKFGARAEQLKVNAQLSRSNPKHASTMMLAAMVQGPQVTKKQVDDAAKAYKEARLDGENFQKQARSSSRQAQDALIRSDQEREKAKSDALVESTGKDVVKELDHKLASEKQTIQVANSMQDAKVKGVVLAGANVRKAREESQLALAKYKVAHAKEYTEYAASLKMLGDQDVAASDQLKHTAHEELKKSIDFQAKARSLKLAWQTLAMRFRSQELAVTHARKMQLMQLTQANQALRSSHRARQREQSLMVKATKARISGEQSLLRAKRLYAAALQLRGKAHKLETQ